MWSLFFTKLYCTVEWSVLFPEWLFRSACRSVSLTEGYCWSLLHYCLQDVTKTKTCMLLFLLFKRKTGQILFYSLPSFYLSRLRLCNPPPLYHLHIPGGDPGMSAINFHFYSSGSLNQYQCLDPGGFFLPTLFTGLRGSSTGSKPMSFSVVSQHTLYWSLFTELKKDRMEWDHYKTQKTDIGLHCIGNLISYKYIMV